VTGERSNQLSYDRIFCLKQQEKSNIFLLTFPLFLPLYFFGDIIKLWIKKHNKKWRTWR
jgi:hypothetical protein